MFSGIIQEMGKIIDIKDMGISKTFEFSAKNVLEKANIGDSIAVNGVCLTVVEITNDGFVADLMNETLKRTTFYNSKLGEIVNFEQSLTLDRYLDGHLTYGDVDFSTKILSIEEDGFAKIYKFEQNPEYAKYFVQKGRVTIDGTSLTVIECNDDYFSVSLIPHTLDNVTIGVKNVNDLVNIETDIFAKHIDKIASGRGSEVLEELTNIKRIVKERNKNDKD